MNTMTIPQKQISKTQTGMIISAILFLYILLSSPLLGQQFTKVTTGAQATDVAASRSVNWIDYDGDGDLDLFVSRGKQGGQNNVMYRNNGAPGFSFTKMDTMIISLDGQPSDGSSWGDADNNGTPDLFVVNWYNRNNLFYINNGKGNFTKNTTAVIANDAGSSETCTWGDYNNDGLLDLYVTNSGGDLKNFLYKNLGNNQFEKITTGAIVNNTQTSRGATWIDFDDDGDLDLFVANENNENENFYKNMLSETGVDTFEAITTGPLVTNGGSSWSASWGDYDNDGDFDVFITNWHTQHNSLFRNDGNGNFVGESMGTLTTETNYFSTAAWVDYDNDGDMDLFITLAYGSPNSKCELFKNTLMENGTVGFTKITSEALLNETGYWYGTSWGDYDDDGDMDVYVAGTLNENAANIMYKNNGTPNNWLTLDCFGTTSNRSAIGAKIKVKASINGNPVWQLRSIEGQGGYCGQTLQQHFGLGNATVIDSLVVRWPSGIQEVFENVPINRHFTIVENDSTPLTLVSPADNAMNTLAFPTLTWQGYFWTAPYRLQVSTDSTFQSNIVVDSVTITDTATGIAIKTNNSVYYWRVQPARTIHPSVWSPVRKFSSMITSPTSAPTLLSPATGDSNKALTQIFRWSKVTDVPWFHLRISEDSSFNTITFEDSTVNDTFKMASNLLNKTKYYWQVRSGNAAGYSAYSPVRYFKTIVDTPAIPVILSPVNNSTMNSVPLTIVWNLVEDASAYRLQVSKDSLFSILLYDFVNLTDTSKELTSLESYTKYFCRIQAYNNGGTSLYGPFTRFFSALTPPSLVSPLSGAHQQVSALCKWSSVKNASWYKYEIAEDSLFSVITLSDSVVLDTFKTVGGLTLGNRYYWRVQSARNEENSVWSNTLWFIVDVSELNVSVSSKWNLVSLPLINTDTRKDSAFPSSISQAFAFNGSGYAVQDSLAHGIGYWLKFDSAEQMTIPGSLLFTDTIDVHEGWNLVGSVVVPIAVSGITTIPGGLMTSQFYGFDNGYNTADSIMPGKGYWVKALQAGTLILSATTLSAKNKIHIVTVNELPPPAPGDEQTNMVTGKPEQYMLEQNYPNPFNPSTVIEYSLPDAGWITLKIYNALGEEIRTLVNEFQDAGYKSEVFHASDLPSGVYTYRLIASALSQEGNTQRYSDTKKLLLIK